MNARFSGAHVLIHAIPLRTIRYLVGDGRHTTTHIFFNHYLYVYVLVLWVVQITFYCRLL